MANVKVCARIELLISTLPDRNTIGNTLIIMSDKKANENDSIFELVNHLPSPLYFVSKLEDSDDHWTESPTNVKEQKTGRIHHKGDKGSKTPGGQTKDTGEGDEAFHFPHFLYLF